MDPKPQPLVGSAGVLLPSQWVRGAAGQRCEPKVSTDKGGRMVKVVVAKEKGSG